MLGISHVEARQYADGHRPLHPAVGVVCEAIVSRPALANELKTARGSRPYVQGLDAFLYLKIEAATAPAESRQILQALQGIAADVLLVGQNATWTTLKIFRPIMGIEERSAIRTALATAYTGTRYEISASRGVFPVPG